MIAFRWISQTMRWISRRGRSGRWRWCSSPIRLSRSWRKSSLYRRFCTHCRPDQRNARDGQLQQEELHSHCLQDVDCDRCQYDREDAISQDANTLVFPPSNLVLMVTTKARPHHQEDHSELIPLKLMPMLRTLHLSKHTARAGDKGSKDHKSPS